MQICCFIQDTITPALIDIDRQQVNSSGCNSISKTENVRPKKKKANSINLMT
jgi:hypothetical protein